MKIGIVDNDLLFNYSPSPKLNVEVMKLCEYYNTNYHYAKILNLMDDFNEYDKIIIVSDETKITDKLKYKLSKTSADIEYFGAAFNNYKNMPLPKEIASLPINTKYYKEIINNYPKIEKATKIEVLSNKYIRIYAFGDEHIDMKTILNNGKYYIVDNDILTKNNAKEEILIYIMMFPKNFKFIKPLIITNYNEFEIYTQLIDFGCGDIKIEFVINDFNEWEKILNTYEQWIKEHHIFYKEKSRFRIGYDSNNCYDHTFFINNIVNLLKIIKLNLNKGFIRDKYCYWDFVNQTRGSGFFAIYRELAHFSFNETTKNTSFEDFIMRKKHLIPINDWVEFKYINDNSIDFKKEAQEKIIVNLRKEEKNGERCDKRQNRISREGIEIWD